MRSPTSASSLLKQEFLKRWITGLQRCRSSISNKKMSVLERKKAIKLSADIAMASARNGATCWSRALIANATKRGGGERRLSLNVSTSKKILKRRRIRRKTRKLINAAAATTKATSLARLVKKRTQVLKSLIPGGEYMNDQVSLIEETLDYIVSLRAQVDVMRSLATAAASPPPFTHHD